MNVWNQDNYIRAWNYASTVHNGQTLPGTTIPYINHIGLVAMEVMAALAHTPDIDFPDRLVLSALLHDTIEDTDATWEDIQNEFGNDVAQGVLALTKNKALATKKEQMQDSLDRIQAQPREIWMVKMADRITNLQPPPAHWNKQKIIDYRQEAGLIWEHLGHGNTYLGDRLKSKIDQYKMRIRNEK